MCIRDRGCAGAHKKVQNQAAGIRQHAYDAFQKLLRFLRRIVELLRICRAGDLLNIRPPVVDRCALLPEPGMFALDCGAPPLKRPLRIAAVLGVVGPAGPVGVPQQHVVLLRHLRPRDSAAGVAVDNLVSEIFRPEYLIHQTPQMMTPVPVAVEHHVSAGL